MKTCILAGVAMLVLVACNPLSNPVWHAVNEKGCPYSDSATQAFRNIELRDPCAVVLVPDQLPVAIFGTYYDEQSRATGGGIGRYYIIYDSSGRGYAGDSITRFDLGEEAEFEVLGVRDSGFVRALIESGWPP